MTKYISPISLLLTILGGVNWLLIGLFECNLVSYLFSSLPIIEKSIYTLVGICGLYCISLFKQICSELSK